MCETPPKIGLAIFPSKERAAQLKRSPAQARPKTSSWFRGGSIFGVAFVRGDRTRKAPTKQCLSWYSWVDSNHRPPDPQSGFLVARGASLFLMAARNCTPAGLCATHGAALSTPATLPLEVPN